MHSARPTPLARRRFGSEAGAALAAPTLAGRMLEASRVPSASGAKLGWAKGTARFTLGEEGLTDVRIMTAICPSACERRLVRL